MNSTFTVINTWLNDVKETYDTFDLYNDTKIKRWRMNFVTQKKYSVPLWRASIHWTLRFVKRSPNTPDIKSLKIYYSLRSVRSIKSNHHRTSRNINKWWISKPLRGKIQFTCCAITHFGIEPSQIELPWSTFTQKPRYASIKAQSPWLEPATCHVSASFHPLLISPLPHPTPRAPGVLNVANRHQFITPSHISLPLLL